MTSSVVEMFAMIRRTAALRLGIFVALATLSSRCGEHVVPMDGSATDVVADIGPPPSGPPCGSAGCANGMACCLITGRCFDPATPSQCAAPADAGTDGCTSDLDCPSGAYCLPNERFPACVGYGRCQVPTSCPTCSGPDCAVCGCDGQTYASAEAACQARMRVAAPGACGVGGFTVPDGGAGRAARIGCGTNSQCPTGMQCCALTSICVPSDCAACCVVPPPGSTGACRTSADCWRVSDYCAAATCDGPGFCEQQPAPLQCDIGVLQPVCGCDGQSYQNECLARSHGVRIAHPGEC